MYMEFLNKNGEVVRRQLKDIGATWEKMNTLNVEQMTKEEKEYLERYGLRTTIFNVANLRTYGHVQLFPHYVAVCLAHGAVDKRGVA